MLEHGLGAESPVVPVGVAGGDSQIDGSWDQRRWARILDRMDFRQAGIGLRFWGPPLWLEVTMTGPDSDSWWAAAAGDVRDQSWNWHSNTSCCEAMRLASTGAGDDVPLSAISRYTLENLVLNAAHEIGGWFPFDGRRLFVAHRSRAQPPRAAGEVIDDRTQENGIVRIDVNFDPDSSDLVSAGPVHVPDDIASVGTPERAAELAAGWRFSYTPGKTVLLATAGPGIADTTGNSGAPRSVWGTTWSIASYQTLDAPPDKFVAAVQRDVHRALIRYETAVICDNFYVDGRRPWYLNPEPGPKTAITSTEDRANRDPVTVSIAYGAELSPEDPDVGSPWCQEDCGHLSDTTDSDAAS